MKLSLHSFEEMIPEKIIARGFNYYEQGQIVHLRKTGEYEFSAYVQGMGDSYTVYVLLDEAQNIVEHHCDCPYDWGNHCKHLVAVLYYLYDSEIHTVEYSVDENIQELKHHLEAFNKEE
ncbi:MAG: SWIM zinc finger family protein, partial [Bacteroidota bacterium]